MTDEQLAATITERCSHSDVRMAHFWADELLVEFFKSQGYDKTVEAYRTVGKWYDCPIDCEHGQGAKSVPVAPAEVE